MASETGSARQEAERLVATVLAMTSQASDDTVKATADRIVGGLGQMGSTLAGFVARATAPTDESDKPATAPGSTATASDKPATAPGSTATASDKAATATAAAPTASASNESSPGGPAAGESASPGRSATHGDPWASATNASSTSAASPAADEGDPWAWATGAVRRVVGGHSGDQPGRQVSYGWSTGSLECCVCPVCRMINSMRNPTPQSAERLATGAGDFASGVVSLMRAFSAVSGTRPRPTRRPATPPPPPDPDLAWSAATRRGSAPVDVPPPVDEDQSPWTAATRTANREADELAAERRRIAQEAAKAAAREKLERQKRERVERAEAAARAKAEAARVDVENAEARPAGTTGEPAPEGPWGWIGGDRAGDVWARATADPGVGDAPATPTVDHDETGGAARE